MLVGAFLVLDPSSLIDNVRTSASRRPGRTSSLAIPIGMIAYTGIETISNMAEEAKDEATTIPAAIKRVVIAVFAIYFTLPCGRAVARCRCAGRRRRDYTTSSACHEEQGGYAGDPISAWSGDRPRRAAAPREIYVGVLAATILVPGHQRGHASASRGSSTRWASTARCPTGCDSCTRSFRTPWLGILVFAASRAITLCPGQAEFLGNMYAFGAMLSFTIAHLA